MRRPALWPELASGQSCPRTIFLARVQWPTEGHCWVLARDRHMESRPAAILLAGIAARIEGLGGNLVLRIGLQEPAGARASASSGPCETVCSEGCVL